MTVVIGILAENGVVIGTDGAATLMQPASARTIEQPTRKIDIVLDGAVIVAGTGEVGLHQRFVDTVRSGLAQRLHGQDAREPLRLVEETSKEAIERFDSTHALKTHSNSTGTRHWADYGALVAFWADGKPHLCEFQVGCLQPELKKRDSVWFVSIGSGQPIADPFLAFLRRVFCPQGLPQLACARMMTCWTLIHAIDVNPGGINEPLQIAVLEGPSKDRGGSRTPTARMLDEGDIQEHRDLVAEAERHLADFRKEQAGSAPPD